MFIKKNKSGQMSETVTWLVATIIIVSILLISVFVSTTPLWKNKKISTSGEKDYFVSKSFFSYLLTHNTEDVIVYSQLEEEDNLNEFNGELAKEIFIGFYGEEYSGIWVGLVSNRLLLPQTSNDYFGRRTDITLTGEDTNPDLFSIIKEEIYFEDKSFEVVMRRNPK
ncbi:MAG: hypothetical protein WDZ62_01000 [Candidatus Pacearchaeota archaeon]